MNTTKKIKIIAALVVVAAIQMIAVQSFASKVSNPAETNVEFAAACPSSVTGGH